jgi:hypothetical protein
VTDRRAYVLFCLGWFLALGYRDALLDHRISPSGWLAFAILWLPTAVFVGALYTWGLTHFTRRAERRADGESGKRPGQVFDRSAWVLPVLVALLALALIVTGHLLAGGAAAAIALIAQWTVNG